MELKPVSDILKELKPSQELIIDDSELFIHKNGLSPMLLFNSTQYGFKSTEFKSKSPPKKEKKTDENKAFLFDKIIGD